MSEKPQKPASFFRKVAGLFYRFDDAAAKPQITDRASSARNLPAVPGSDDVNDAQPPKEMARESAPVVNFPESLEREPKSPPKQELPAFVFPQDNASKSADEKPVIKSPTISSQETEAAIEPDAGKRFPSIVSFRNVYKVFNQGSPNEFTALKNVSFDIEDLPDIGEFIALVGPSGCGKSTVLNLIQGFQEVGPPTIGEVLVRNKPVTGPGRDRGMIFQKYSSFPHLTVLQNVMFGLRLNRESLGYSDLVMEKLSREMIAKVGMKGHEDKYPYQLSGGQQQRVAIARTLVLKPRIILMDEPFSALDEPTRLEMQLLITSLWHEVEATVFIVTHSLAEAVYLSDRIFMFKSNPGRLAKQIMIKAEEIGKHDGMSPMEVQESSIFTHYLKSITEEFMQIGGSD